MTDRLVTVATYQDPVAAQLAQNYLDSHGIPSILLDETTVATDWMLAGAIGGVKLQVAPIQVERAEMLLHQIKEQQDENEAADEEEPLSVRTAIATQEIAEDLRSERADKAPINQLVDRLFRVVVLGFLFWPLQLYGLWLLFQLTQEPGTVSPDRRWKVWVCALMSPVIAISLFFLMCSCSFPRLLI